MDLKSKLKKHTRIHTGEKPFQCSVCNKSLSGRLERHMKTHSGIKPFQCSVCNKSLSGHLERHMKTHSRKKPFQCPKCSKSFSENSNLKTHLRIHSGEKPFQCSECFKSFSQRGNLQVHMRTHSGEKTFQCPECLQTFLYKYQLADHINTHTQQEQRDQTDTKSSSKKEPFYCSECLQLFSHKLHYIDHMIRTHSGDKLFQCSQCNKLFVDDTSLKSHIADHPGVTTRSNTHTERLRLPHMIMCPSEAKYLQFFKCEIPSQTDTHDLKDNSTSTMVPCNVGVKMEHDDVADLVTSDLEDPLKLETDFEPFKQRDILEENCIDVKEEELS